MPTSTSLKGNVYSRNVFFAWNQTAAGQIRACDNSIPRDIRQKDFKETGITMTSNDGFIITNILWWKSFEDHSANIKVITKLYELRLLLTKRLFYLVSRLFNYTDVITHSFFTPILARRCEFMILIFRVTFTYRSRAVRYMTIEKKRKVPNAAGRLGMEEVRGTDSTRALTFTSRR